MTLIWNSPPRPQYRRIGVLSNDLLCLAARVSHLEKLLGQEESLPALLPISTHRPLKIEKIKTVVCRYYSIAPNELLHSRTHDSSWRRSVAVYLAYMYARRTRTSIAKEFGYGRHDMINHIVERVSSKRRADPALDAEIRFLERKLGV